MDTNICVKHARRGATGVGLDVTAEAAGELADRAAEISRSMYSKKT